MIVWLYISVIILTYDRFDYSYIVNLRLLGSKMSVCVKVRRDVPRSGLNIKDSKKAISKSSRRRSLPRVFQQK